jgi:hypothetical protein
MHSFTAMSAPDVSPEELLILEAFTDGVPTAEIAERTGLSQRRVQQIVAPLRDPALPVPDDDRLDELVTKAVLEHGPNYGVPMIEGALTAAHPEFSFSRRRLQRSLEKLFPTDYESRRCSQLAQLASPHQR